MANNVMKITAADFEKVVRNAVNQRMQIAMADPLPAGGDTGRHKPNPNQPPSSPYEKGKSPHKLAHTPHTPESTYDDYGRPEKVPRYKGGNPGGGLIEIPWMKEEYEKKHQQLEQLHNEKYHQAGATSRQIRDRLKPFTKGKGYEDSGGSLRGIPDALRIQLLRDAMAQNLPANNIRSLQESGHQTVLDDNRPGNLKIIKQFNPPKA